MIDLWFLKAWKELQRVFYILYRKFLEILETEEIDRKKEIK